MLQIVHACSPLPHPARRNTPLFFPGQRPALKMCKEKNGTASLSRTMESVEMTMRSGISNRFKKEPGKRFQHFRKQQKFREEYYRQNLERFGSHTEFGRRTNTPSTTGWRKKRGYVTSQTACRLLTLSGTLLVLHLDTEDVVYRYDL